jgi:hypothetical protein
LAITDLDASFDIAYSQSIASLITGFCCGITKQPEPTTAMGDASHTCNDKNITKD